MTTCWYDIPSGFFCVGCMISRIPPSLQHLLNQVHGLPETPDRPNLVFQLRCWWLRFSLHLNVNPELIQLNCFTDCFQTIVHENNSSRWYLRMQNTFQCVSFATTTNRSAGKNHSTRLQSWLLNRPETAPQTFLWMHKRKNAQERWRLTRPSNVVQLLIDVPEPMYVALRQQTLVRNRYPRSLRTVNVKYLVVIHRHNRSLNPPQGLRYLFQLISTVRHDWNKNSNWIVHFDTLRPDRRRNWCRLRRCSWRWWRWTRRRSRTKQRIVGAYPNLTEKLRPWHQSLNFRCGLTQTTVKSQLSQIHHTCHPIRFRSLDRLYSFVTRNNFRVWLVRNPIRWRVQRPWLASLMHHCHLINRNAQPFRLVPSKCVAFPTSSLAPSDSSGAPLSPVRLKLTSGVTRGTRGGTAHTQIKVRRENRLIKYSSTTKGNKQRTDTADNH